MLRSSKTSEEKDAIAFLWNRTPFPVGDPTEEQFEQLRNLKPTPLMTADVVECRHGCKMGNCGNCGLENVNTPKFGENRVNSGKAKKQINRKI